MKIRLLTEIDPRHHFTPDVAGKMSKEKRRDLARQSPWEYESDPVDVFSGERAKLVRHGDQAMRIKSTFQVPVGRKSGPITRVGKTSKAALLMDPVHGKISNKLFQMRAQGATKTTLDDFSPRMRAKLMTKARLAKRKHKNVVETTFVMKKKGQGGEEPTYLAPGEEKRPKRGKKGRRGKMKVKPSKGKSISKKDVKDFKKRTKYMRLFITDSNKHAPVLSGASRAFLKVSKRAGKQGKEAKRQWKLYRSVKNANIPFSKFWDPKDKQKISNLLASKAENLEQKRDDAVQRAERLMSAIPTTSSRKKEREKRNKGHQTAWTLGALGNRAYPSGK